MKNILLIVMGLGFVSCSTTGSHVTDSSSAWVNVKDIFGSELMWCVVELNAPKCTRPAMFYNNTK